MSQSTPVACSLTDPDVRERLDLLRSGLFAEVRSVREGDEGFTFAFENTDANVKAILNVVLLERQCCPFLHFTVSIRPQPDELALRISGPGEARTFVEHTFVALVS